MTLLFFSSLNLVQCTSTCTFSKLTFKCTCLPDTLSRSAKLCAPVNYIAQPSRWSGNGPTGRKWMLSSRDIRKQVILSIPAKIPVSLASRKFICRQEVSDHWASSQFRADFYSFSTGELA